MFTLSSLPKRLVLAPAFRTFKTTAAIMGVTKTITKEGDGPTPKKGDTVVMHYTGWQKHNGAKFDSSLDRGKPFETRIGVGQVIRGWDESVINMKRGEKATLEMTSDYGYGAQGIPNLIEKNATLIFDVELLEIK